MMKLFIVTLITVLMSQLTFATGGVGEDPNMAKSESSEAGSTFISAVGKSDQPAFCEKCQQKNANLSDQRGTLTTVTSASTSRGQNNSPEPVKSGK